MNTDHHGSIRNRFLALAGVLAGLLVLGSCGHSGEAITLNGCSPRRDCQFVIASDVASPSGRYHAILGTQSCKYSGQPYPVSVDVKVTGLKQYGAGLDASREPVGPAVFNSWTFGLGQATGLSASDVQVEWRGDSELVVHYPAGSAFSCNLPIDKEIIVHCVERGFKDRK